MIYQKNVAPESDAQILVDAVYDAIEAFGGAERFAQTLATGYLVDEQRKAA
jgi:hypothetical protein